MAVSALSNVGIVKTNQPEPRTRAVTLIRMSSARIFRYFKTSPEFIRLAARMYVCHPLSLRNVEDLLHERGIDITHETVRFWWNRSGMIFAAEIGRNRLQVMRRFQHWRLHLDEVFVKINGLQQCLWRAVDHEENA